MCAGLWKVIFIKADNRVSLGMDCERKLQCIEDEGYCTMLFENVMDKGRIRILSGDEKATEIMFR